MSVKRKKAGELTGGRKFWFLPPVYCDLTVRLDIRNDHAVF